MPEQLTSTNFSFLAAYDTQLVRLGALAERYFKDDPTTSLIKLRQYGETLAQLVAAKAGLFRDPQEPQADLLRRLQFDRVVPRDVGELLPVCFRPIVTALLGVSSMTNRRVRATLSFPSTAFLGVTVCDLTREARRGGACTAH